MAADKDNWSVYIISCHDGSLYTGISTDVERRFKQHKNKKGAKYFYSRRPEKIVYIEDKHNKSTAAQREHEIKSLNRKQKLVLIYEHNKE